MKTKTKTVTVVDMFCGAGGMTEGHMQACRELGFKPQMIAINHWDRAIETHSLNHPEAQHYCDEMQSLDPWVVVPGGKLDLLLAGPECTHFSKARGGKPKSNQSRASAWHVVRWAEALNIRAILIENVSEFLGWGPLDAKGRPIKSRRGETFLAFINALKSLNYRVDWRVLNCANYGDPTTRAIIHYRSQRQPENPLARSDPQPDRRRDALRPTAEVEGGAEDCGLVAYRPVDLQPQEAVVVKHHAAHLQRLAEVRRPFFCFATGGHSSR